MTIASFVATACAIMFEYKNFSLVKKLVGYAVCKNYSESGDSVFYGSRFVTMGKYSNYSLVVLYWLIVMHTVFALTLFLNVTLWIFNFHLEVVSSSSNSELLSEFFSNKIVFAYVINAGTIKSIGDIHLFYAIVVFYGIPFLLCFLVVLWKIHHFDFKIAKRDGDDKAFVLGYVWATFLFFCFAHCICSGAFVIRCPQLFTFSFVCLAVTITLVYGILTYFIYKYYLELLREDSLLIKMSGRMCDCSMKLELRDGTVIDFAGTPFYPVLLEDNKLYVVFKDDRQRLKETDVVSLIICSAFKPNGFFARPVECGEVSTKQYYF